MNRLISRACLGLEQEELQAKEAKTPGEDQTVVMNGSLGAIYTKALNIAYAKADPLTGTPSLETQALDYYKAAQIKTSGDKSTKPTDNVIDVVNNGTTLKTDSSVDETIEVIKEL